MNGPPASTARTFLILFESENLPFLCELPANLAWNLFQNLLTSTYISIQTGILNQKHVMKTCCLPSDQISSVLSIKPVINWRLKDNPHFQAHHYISIPYHIYILYIYILYTYISSPQNITGKQIIPSSNIFQAAKTGSMKLMLA